jgi:hypothetical protein
MERKNSDWNQFIKFIIAASLIIFIAALYPVFKYADKIQINSFTAGYFVSLLNAFIGFKLNTLAFAKPVKKFMVLVFGGMGIRIIVVILLLIILLQFKEFEAVSLISSVFFFYTVFISIEIFFIHKKQLALDKGKTIE